MSDENTITKSEKANLKSQEITFDRFAELLKTAIGLGEARAISQAFSLIKKGFLGDFNKEQVDLAFNILKDWKYIDLLALKLINEEKNGKLSFFAKQLTGKIRFYFIQELKYPIPMNSTTISRDVIFDWIKNSFKSFPLEIVKNRDSQSDVPEKLRLFFTLEKFLRMAFVCLSNNSQDGFIIEAIDYLLTQYLINKGKKFKLSRIYYINSVNKALASKTAHVAVENILVSSAPFKEIAVESKENENELWKNVQNLQGRLNHLETSEVILRNQLGEAVQKNEEFSTQLSNKTQALEAWKKENKDLDQHWQEVVKQQLTKQGNDFKRKLQHEISGLKLSLENSPPDIEIALLLLQRIEKILGDSDLNAK